MSEVPLKPLTSPHPVQQARTAFWAQRKQALRGHNLLPLWEGYQTGWEGHQAG